jgi:nucleotide-binding universal stress UspA family protein
MYEKILVSLDGSLLSESILPYAGFLAAKLNVPVELLHVIDVDMLKPSRPGAEARQREILSAEREKSGAYLKKIAQSLGASVKASWLIESGKPADVIVDKAAGSKRTLIAMTTHGRSGVNRWLLGSVADKVLHAAANPLLLIRAKETAVKVATAPLKRILVPLDGSELAETVIPDAADLAQKIGLEIVLMRIFGFPTPVFAEDYGPYVEELWADLETEARNYLDEKARQLLAQGLTQVSTIAEAGFAEEKIIDLARQRADCLIAMCTHGRSGMNRWVMGSVTDRVVRHSGDPVLIVRAPISTGGSV